MNKYFILAVVAIGGYMLFGNKEEQSAPGTNGQLSREEMIAAVQQKLNFPIGALNDFSLRFTDNDVKAVYEYEINGNYISGSEEAFRAMLRNYGWQ